MSLFARLAHLWIAALLACLPIIGNAATPVKTAPLGELATLARAEAAATVVSLNLSMPAAQIGAAVLEVPVRPGEHVAKGDLLIRLDCERHQLAVTQTKSGITALDAQRDLARTQLRRAEKLVKQKNTSEELVDQRRAELRRLNAEIEGQSQTMALKQRDVADCEIRAPFAGLVVERLVSVGDLASVGTPLLRLLDVEDLEVSAQVLTQEAANFDRVEHFTFIHQGLRYPLRLRSLSPSIDPITRTREARLQFIDAPALPGAGGRLEWTGAQRLLPADLLVHRGTALGVFIADEHRARFLALPEAIEGRPAMIPADSGLRDDSRLITAGRHALKDGDAISDLAANADAHGS